VQFNTKRRAYRKDALTEKLKIALRFFAALIVRSFGRSVVHTVSLKLLALAATRRRTLAHFVGGRPVA